MGWCPPRFSSQVPTCPFPSLPPTETPGGGGYRPPRSGCPQTSTAQVGLCWDSPQPTLLSCLHPLGLSLSSSASACPWSGGGEVPCFLTPLSSSPGVFSSVTWGEGRTSHHACCSPADRLMSPPLRSPPSQTGWKVGRRLVVGLVLLTLSRPCVRCVNGCVNGWPQMSGAVFGTWSVEYLPFLALVPSISAGYSQTPAQFLAAPGSGRAEA